MKYGAPLVIVIVCVVGGGLILKGQRQTVAESHRDKPPVQTMVFPAPVAGNASQGGGAEAKFQAFRRASTRRERQAEFERLLPSLTNADAVELVELLPVGPEYDRGLEGVIKKLLASDPQFAKNWLLHLPPEAANAYAFSVFGREYVKLDPAGAKALCAEITDRVKAMKFASQMLINSKPDDFFANVAWARENAPLVINMGVAIRDAAGTATEEQVMSWISGTEDGEIRKTLAALLAERHRPREAVAAPPPPPDTGNAATGEAAEIRSYRGLASRDPIEASEQLTKMPPSGGKDERVAILAEAIVFRQPKESFTWALEIRDAALQEKVLRNVVAANTSESLVPLIESARIGERLKTELMDMAKAKQQSR